jgi:RNA polymerase sigma-70 factor (ECF subfamily)
VKAAVYEPEERLLIEAAQQDPGRFAELYENNFDRVYAYIVRRVEDRELAEDLTSEVFHHALANLHRFEWRGVPFAAWLFRIAANAMADRWQKMRGKQEISADLLLDVLVKDGADEQIERNLILFQLVESLPPEQQHVIRRRFVEQRSTREVAEEMGRSEGAIKQIQFRALAALRMKVRGNHG